MTKQPYAALVCRLMVSTPCNLCNYMDYYSSAPAEGHWAAHCAKSNGWSVGKPIMSSSSCFTQRGVARFTSWSRPYAIWRSTIMTEKPQYELLGCLRGNIRHYQIVHCCCAVVLRISARQVRELLEISCNLSCTEKSGQLNTGLFWKTPISRGI